MILLDTNIVSEAMSARAPAHVLGWLDAQPAQSLYLSSLTLAELRAGIERLPQGARKTGLEAAYGALETELFAGRILSFDAAAALAYGAFHAKRLAMGRPLPVMDGLIAAIAKANGMALATRNITDFHGLDLQLINPFEGKTA